MHACFDMTVCYHCVVQLGRKIVHVDNAMIIYQTLQTLGDTNASIRKAWRDQMGNQKP